MRTSVRRPRMMLGLVAAMARTTAVAGPRAPGRGRPDGRDHPLRPRAASSDERARIRGLLRAGATGSISWMSTWHGTRYWFAPDGRSAVAYRVTGNVAVTLGEPIARQGDVVGAARGFATACSTMGLTPAFYAVRPETAERLGTGRAWPTVPIGRDAVIDPGTFSLTGRRWQDVRSSISRAERSGVEAVWTTWERSSPDVRRQLHAIAAEWLAERRMPELEFTVGGIRELQDPDVRLMLAVGPGGRVDAATSWLPTYRDGTLVGWTLDFMRRRPEGMNGLMEFLIASTVLAARRGGLEFVSLSVTPLAGVGGCGRDDVLVRALGRAGGALEPIYGFASLQAFKDKFQPRAQPLVLAYPDAIALPAIALALGRIYLPHLSLPAAARLLAALR